MPLLGINVLPKFFQIKQTFNTLVISDVVAETRRQMASLRLPDGRGKFVAITAGSRGIHGIAAITKTIVDYFKELDYRPFIVPAMGSHGGATSSGQLAVLEKCGITKISMGCEIRSSLETVVLGVYERKNAVPIEIHFDKIASEADGVFLANRIKPHTRFSGPIESGLSKMLMIGLGKAVGASVYHRAFYETGFDTAVRTIGKIIQSRVNILGGIGIVENAEGSTAIIRAAVSDKLIETDERLLVSAKKLLPMIPFDEIDLLFVDRIGKDISGTGMDTNVIGRKFDDHKAVSGERPNIRCIAVRGLTPQTAGNANGIGIAEFCLSSVLREIDVEKTRINAIAANHVSAAMIPLDYPTDFDIMFAACQTLGQIPLEELRIVWITDTAHLETIRCSQSLKIEAENFHNNNPERCVLM